MEMNKKSECNDASPGQQTSNRFNHENNGEKKICRTSNTLKRFKLLGKTCVVPVNEVENLLSFFYEGFFTCILFWIYIFLLAKSYTLAY